ncbi:MULTISPECIES: hypothetical protein [unclassified Oceanobacillus]|uniref:hypothetical protein n=1 Tax=unclassified Oceanobacillus TaxID=2630292 RepID=UPI0012EB9E25|nr:hypothetical protein [Oceanobacillus sp. AG]
MFLEKKKVLTIIHLNIAILFSSLNYYVQVALKGIPLILNKLFAIIFAIVLAMLLTVTGTVFTY